MHWGEFLLNFNFIIKYKLNKCNLINNLLKYIDYKLKKLNTYIIILFFKFIILKLQKIKKVILNIYKNL